MRIRHIRSLVLLSMVASAPFSMAAQEGPTEHALTLRRPRVLFVAHNPNSEMLAELLRHQVPADVTLAPLSYGDLEMHHLCDKPLEETKEDQAFVQREGARFLDSMLAKREGVGAVREPPLQAEPRRMEGNGSAGASPSPRKEFDVVIAQIPPRSSNQEENERLFGIQRLLVKHVRGGGRLVVLNPGWETTFEDTPLAEIVPVKSGKGKTWVYSCGRATDHPLVRGIPLEITGAHFYGPIYEPADATCVALTGQPGQTRFWYRRLPEEGQVVHLFQVAGERWQWSGGTHAGTYDPERPDDGAAWNVFYRRLLLGLTHGDQAFPVLVKIDLPEGAKCRWGDRLAIPVDVENRSGREEAVTVGVEVSHRRTSAKIADVQKVPLKAGERRVLRFECAVSLPCTDSWLEIRARALDASGTTTLSESTAWVPYVHRIPLTVKTDKASYRPGEAIRVSLEWGKEAQPGTYVPAVYLTDRSGRILRRASDAKLVQDGAPGSVTASLTMPDWGPEFVGCYWVTAVMSAGDQVAATARAQVQLDRPWTMREQFQWSLWTHGGSGRRIDLYRDGGFNALGCVGSPYTADRYAMRQYVEGTGIDTFSVTIDHETWGAVRAAMEKTAANLEKNGPDARSKSLVSLGEESGFKGGWGMRYYWPEDKAPAVPQKVFDDYLRDLYAGQIERLNQEWGSAYKSFDEVPLQKAKVKMPAQVFVTSQAWEAMQKKGEAKAVLPVDISKLSPARKYVGHSAPYWETYRFFDWYYQKYCDLATEVYRTRRNPVPLTIMSAPGGFYPKVDVYNFGGLGPFYPKEAALVGNAAARLAYGDVPGFSAAMWAYFDLRSLWSCTVLSSILAGNTHMDYWVDVPLTFNADLTHTRASFWTKALRWQLRPIEPILLHKRFAYTKGLGMLLGEQPLPHGVLGKQFGSSTSPNAPIYSALEESGYLPRVVDAKDLKDIRVLVASHAQVLSPEEGEGIARFVHEGGLLIATPWLASCSPHGNVLTVYPAEETGLADLLGFKLLSTSQELGQEDVTADLSGQFPVGPLTLRSKGRDAILEMAADVQVLTRYKDGTPLVLSRRVGQGRVVHLNFVYDWDNWWNSFHEPPREAYRKLVEAILRADGRVRPEYFIAFEAAEAVEDNKGWWGMVMRSKPEPGESVPWWASQLYADPGGRIRYLGVFADHRSPKIAARVRWGEPNVRFFDLFTGNEVPSSGGMASLTLRPGEAALWAILREAPGKPSLSVPRRVEAGAPLRAGVRIPRAERDAVYGATLEVHDPSGRLSSAHSVYNVNAPGGKAVVEVPTAANDPPGRYRIVLTDSITRAQAEAEFRLVAAEPAPEREVLTPFPRRASEEWPVLRMTPEEFLEELGRLRAIYEGTFAGLEAKYMLSYYLNVPFRPDNRHAILRRLQRTDWTPHLQAVADALRRGERFYLFGEDLNVDPLTEQRIDPFAVADPPAFVSALARAARATPRAVAAEGFRFTILSVGRGALVTGHASVDRGAYRSSDFIAWHGKLRNALRRVLEHQ